MLSNKQ